MDLITDKKEEEEKHTLKGLHTSLKSLELN